MCYYFKGRNYNVSYLDNALEILVSEKLKHFEIASCRYPFSNTLVWERCVAFIFEKPIS